MQIKQSFRHSQKLLIVLILAATLRLWGLGINPPHLTPDEAALGYNAYSILKTGKDEHGAFLPVVFKSFGDYKPGLYVYSALPFVATLGLNEVAVRLPSALSGIVAVWLLYLIVGKLFPKHKNLALSASFVLAVSPWHVQFSRGAWEVNLALTLTLVGIYFFLRSLDKHKYIVYSVIFFALTLLSYQGAKLSTALVVFALVVSYWKEFIAIDKKVIAKSLVFGIIISLPILLSLVQGRAGRLKVFSVFSASRSAESVTNFLSQSGVEHNGVIYKLFYTQDLAHLRGVLGRWSNHYSTRFLFFEGDWQNPMFSSPNHGMLLVGELVIILIGLVGLIRSKENTRFIWLWLMLAPLPAALSRDQVHAVRALNMIIPISIVTAVGVHLMLKNRLTGIVLVSLYLGSIIYFLDSYFIHQPVHNAKYWQYGYKQSVQAVVKVEDKYDTIRWEQSYAQPYMYYLFYTKYSPREYRQQNSFIDGGLDVGLVERVGKIEFSRDIPGLIPGLVIADSTKMPLSVIENQENTEVVKSIQYPDGSNAFNLMEVK